MIIEEIIRKEEEKHQLVEIGAITDFRGVIKRAAASSHFRNGYDYKSQREYLRYFYETVIGYGRFIAMEKAGNFRLKGNLRRKAASHLSKLRMERSAVLDTELKTGAKITIAYHLSDNKYDAVYSSFCESVQTFATPDDVHTFFSRILDKEYPVDMGEYMRLLENDDPGFWEVTCIYLKNLSEIVGRYVFPHLNRAAYHDIIGDNTWSDAYEIIRRRIVEKEGNLPEFKNGKNFRNYLIQICHFRISNLYKKHTGKEYNTDEFVFDRHSDTDTDDDYESGTIRNLGENSDVQNECDIETVRGVVKELDIDTGNPYEVAHSISIILLNSGHPLRSRLVEGIEDKVAVLIDKSVNGMSYKEIVADLYGTDLHDADFEKAVAKARKDYERVRKTLTDRLIDIIKDENRHISGTLQIM